MNEDKHLVWPSYVHLFCCATIPCSVTLVQAWDILANFVMIITNNKSILQAIIVEVISEKGERGTNVHNVHIVIMSQLQNDKIGLMSKWLWEVPTSQYYMYYSVFSRYSPVTNTLTTAHCLTLQNLSFSSTDNNNYYYCLHLRITTSEFAMLSSFKMRDYTYTFHWQQMSQMPRGKTYGKEIWDMVKV